MRKSLKFEEKCGDFEIVQGVEDNFSGGEKPEIEFSEIYLSIFGS